MTSYDDRERDKEKPRESEREKGKAASFWNARAADFPRWSDRDNAYELGILETMRRLGADFSGRTVLDVGAGSGQYTLELAREAGRVTAVDLSEEMLRLSRLDAGRLGIDNVEWVLSDWDGFAAEGRFDVVFCMMCPAVRDDAAREKLFGLAREAVAFGGFARYFPPPALEAVLGRRGLAPKGISAGPEMLEFLDRTGRRYARELKEGVWRIPYTREKYLRMLAAFLDDYGVVPEPGEAEREVDLLDPQGAGVFTAELPYAVQVIVCPAG
ncbi:MAG: class I SAM-dependent methyltransferase [Deltaproteobacteria bacterium]|nr:class I SAM-dependent methyltransferase [Deltaproteobacteria bacterium]